jgi:hypothetical protein
MVITKYQTSYYIQERGYTMYLDSLIMYIRVWSHVDAAVCLMYTTSMYSGTQRLVKR